MEIGIERLTALAFLLTGLSHIAAPRTWVRFFALLRAQGEAGGFLNGYVHVPLGLLILAFHQVWSWPGLFVTLIGVGLTLKGLICFVWPGTALRSMERMSEDRIWEVQAAGVIALLVGAAAGWVALRGG